MTNIKSLRLKLKLNQTPFWLRVGVTQSAGSRYEDSRRIPKPVRMLLAIAYGTKAECKRAVESLTGGKHGY